MMVPRANVRAAPGTQPRQRIDRDGPPAPREHVTYQCQRGHQDVLAFAAGAVPPAARDCRCGAPARPLSQRGPETDTTASMPPADQERARRMAMLRDRRTTAELEVILAERLAELASATTGR